MEYLLTEEQYNKKYNRQKRLTKMMRRIKNKKSKPIKRPSVPKYYRDYINSNWWFKRRDKYFKDFGKKCVICGSERICQLHHLAYQDFGFEKDEDLACLCKECHDEYHYLYGSEGNCHNNFAEFCASKVNNPTI